MPGKHAGGPARRDNGIAPPGKRAVLAALASSGRHAASAPARRRAAAIALAAGVVLAGAGAAGLALTRHPVTSRSYPVTALPAPTGPIVAARQSRAAPVAVPVALVIPSIGVRANVIDLGLTPAGALQVPATTTVAGWYAGQSSPRRHRAGGHRRAHRLPRRPGHFLPPVATGAG